MPCTSKNRPIRAAGFSLVELSIVLVILGLLVGGILSGQSLIRASELRAVTTEYDRYRTAIQTFRGKYFGLPGDLNNATSFWGYTGGAGCTNNSGTAAVSPGTCDGNGDGILRYATVPGQSGEPYQGWRHLALAGLIEGSYTGMSTAPGLPFPEAVEYAIGVNCPESKIRTVGWGMSYFDALAAAHIGVYNQNYLNWFNIGKNDTYWTDAPFLKPEEAWNIDNKIDDGMPARGNMQSWPACSTSASVVDFSNPYKLSDSAVLCPLIMKW